MIPCRPEYYRKDIPTRARQYIPVAVARCLYSYRTTAGAKHTQCLYSADGRLHTAFGHYHRV